MSTLNKTWYICENYLIAVHVADTEVWMQRRERVVCYFGAGPCDGAQESGFSSIGQTDKSGISNKFQPQPEPTFFARPSVVGAPRSLIRS